MRLARPVLASCSVAGAHERPVLMIVAVSLAAER
jgi:hypothetical protein